MWEKHFHHSSTIKYPQVVGWLANCHTIWGSRVRIPSESGILVVQVKKQVKGILYA